MQIMLNHIDIIKDTQASLDEVAGAPEAGTQVRYSSVLNFTPAALETKQVPS